jgi:hypothetical protein
MRLMLGHNERPSLLVDITKQHSPTRFDFWVVNGAWDGTYTDGYVTVWHPWNPHTDLDKVEILCDNQDRLRGPYTTVFENFDNPEYVAPKPKPLPDYWDDDIPF